MSVEQNKAIRQTFVKRISAKDLDGALALVSPDFVSHAAGRHDGIEGVRRYFDMVFSAFPDFRTTSLLMLGEGDLIVDMMRTEGTHTGMFMGMPPTGRSASWTFIDIMRIDNGKIVEHWNETDALGMMQQLGLIPQMT